MLSPELEHNENMMFNSIKAALFTLVMGLCAIEQVAEILDKVMQTLLLQLHAIQKKNLDLFSIRVQDTNRRPEVVVLNMGDI